MLRGRNTEKWKQHKFDYLSIFDYTGYIEYVYVVFSLYDIKVINLRCILKKYINNDQRKKMVLNDDWKDINSIEIQHYDNSIYKETQ